jgi:hypothetical protein
VRLALWDKTPGEHVHVKVRRKHVLGVADLDLEVVLAAAQNTAEKR